MVPNSVVKQETNQAAENNSLPPVSASRLRPLMTVSFKTRAVDTWYFFSYLATKTVAGRCLFIFFLLFPLLGPAVAWYTTVPGSKAERFMAEAFVPAVLATYVLLAFSMFLGGLLGTVILPLTTMTIDPQFCYRKDWFNHKFSWRTFSTVTEEAEYFYFLRWRGAFYIPKLAFDSRAEADAFYQTALQFWREAKGLPPPSVPDTTGVWPPPPRPGNSAEPGDSPQR